jgi:hypothetical protein
MAWCCARLYTCGCMGFDSPHLQTIPHANVAYSRTVPTLFFKLGHYRAGCHHNW